MEMEREMGSLQMRIIFRLSRFHHRKHILNLGKNILSLSEFESVFYVLELNSDIQRGN